MPEQSLYDVLSFYLQNYLAWKRLFKTTTIEIQSWVQITLLEKQ